MKKPVNKAAKQLARRAREKQRQLGLVKARAEKAEQRTIMGWPVRLPARDVRERTEFGRLAMALERRSHDEMLAA